LRPVKKQRRPVFSLLSRKVRENRKGGEILAKDVNDREEREVKRGKVRVGKDVKKTLKGRGGEK